MFGLDRITRLFGKKDLDCVEVRKLSSEYLEGDLLPSRLERFRDHISGCGPCRAFVDSLAAMVEMLRGMPVQSSPPTLKQSIMQRIADERGPTSDGA